ncbi:zinc finger protein 681-like [Adelges cooleyi]|uniref:zinc finger protein 681-like n=1 Tax=Adelges cooleyi TaxID=133065 RepID=UPI00217F8FDD|nr:zinc finger protein 681-like [Adelges cooleyi]
MRSHYLHDCEDVEEGRWICPNVCGRSYKHKGHLSFHLARECGVGPQYTCAQCLKHFKRISHLNSHLLSCGNPAPRFQCDICYKITRKEPNITKKAKSKKKKNEKAKKNMVCAVCSKSFQNNSSLNRHLHTHVRSKGILTQYKCENCDKYFAKKQNMKTHKALLHGVLE